MTLHCFYTSCPLEDWFNRFSVLQAIETGVKLQSVYDTLENAVKHTTDVHQWPVWKNEINVVRISWFQINENFGSRNVNIFFVHQWPVCKNEINVACISGFQINKNLNAEMLIFFYPSV